MYLLPQFQGFLERELEAAEARQAEFVEQCSQQDYDEVVASWRDKLARVKAGEQRWGLFRAFRPSHGRDFHTPEHELQTLQ
jgi:hypothetical protein